MDSSWTVYVLECADGTLYTGIASDLDRRLRQHNGLLAGGPRYTSGRRPVRLRRSTVSVQFINVSAENFPFDFCRRLWM